MMKSDERQKRSFIAGGLISTAGIFFAKFLGLFYAVPFNSILGGGANIAIYGVAYNIYNYVLNICLAGVPFAIATLVAKYVSQEDYRTAIMVKKLSTTFMIAFGVLAMLFMIVCAAPFASMLLPKGAVGVSDQATADNIVVMRNVLMIVAIAIFFVPILSSIRGFYQGLKDLDIYALSQVLEQVARVVFLLVSSAIAVYLLGMERTWAVYFGAFSTSIAAILAIIHIRLYDRKQMKEIKALADAQTRVANTDMRSLFHELIFISVPYLFVAIFGYSDSIINSFLLKGGMEAYYLGHGGGVEVNGTMVLSELASAELTIIIGSINYAVVKLMSIPMVLAPGFSSALLPHITSSLVRKEYKAVQKNICECIESVLYIALPVCFCLFVFAKPIYALLFPPSGYPENALPAAQLITDEQALDLCAEVLRWFSIEALLSTLGPIFSSLMMAVEQRKLNIRNLAVIVTLKFVITYPLLAYFGYPGLIFSSLISMITFFWLDGYALSRRFHINWKNTFRRITVMVGGLVIIAAVAFLCQSIGLRGYGCGRLLGIVQLGISGCLAILAYFLFTYYFQLPQLILHLDPIKWIRRRSKK